MIVYLKGLIQYKDLNFVIINVKDVGYQVFVAPVQLSKIPQGETRELFIYEHIREDARELYGFVSMEELQLFRRLLSVSGVGPKSAQNILVLDSPDKVEEAIEQGNVSFLTRVSGVGKKIAERMILELKGKLITGKTNKVNDLNSEVADALVGLGYSKQQANEVLNKVSDSLSIEEKIKESLKLLGK